MNDTNHGQMQPSLYRLSQLAIEAAEHAEAVIVTSPACRCARLVLRAAGISEKAESGGLADCGAECRRGGGAGGAGWGVLRQHADGGVFPGGDVVGMRGAGFDAGGAARGAQPQEPSGAA